MSYSVAVGILGCAAKLLSQLGNPVIDIGLDFLNRDFAIRRFTAARMTCAMACRNAYVKRPCPSSGNSDANCSDPLDARTTVPVLRASCAMAFCSAAPLRAKVSTAPPA